MVFQSQVALSSFLFVFLHKDAAAYIVENPRELPNLMPPRSKQNGGGLAPPSFANQDLQLVGQQGLLGETNDMMKRLSLGRDYAVAPVVEAPLEDISAEASVEDLLEEAQVEEAAIRQEQIEPTKTLKEPIVTGWDVSEEAEEEEVVATLAEPEAMTPPPVEKEEEANEIAPAQQDEQKVSLTMAVDDFTAKFMQRKRVNSVLTPPPRPIVNLKPAFVAEKNEAPAAPGIVVSSRIQDFIDYPMGTTLQNEEQEIPTLVAEENDNVKESDESQARMDSSQLQKMNKAAASGQTDYFANRYHYDSWFDNPNSNNLFLRAMHIE
eukprot:scaffold2153_cov131-Cylindrotheca_fusiformis.AAC.5